MKTADIIAQYLDHMGTDLTCVNAARTSFGKESTWNYEQYQKPSREDPTILVPGQRKVLKPDDVSLVRFLARGFRTKDWDALLEEIIDHARHGSEGELTTILLGYKKSAQHWAPFGHPHVQLRMKLPMFLARQFVKHQIGGVWSEESRRYMSSEPEFWFPSEWHARPDDIKQGSDGLVEDQDTANTISAQATEIALSTYRALMDIGIAPEEARIILPLNTMTTVTWTGSLLFWSRVCNQRLDGHAQKAANELAKHMDGIIRPLFPVSWPELLGER